MQTLQLLFFLTESRHKKLIRTSRSLNNVASYHLSSLASDYSLPGWLHSSHTLLLTFHGKFQMLICLIVFAVYSFCWNVLPPKHCIAPSSPPPPSFHLKVPFLSNIAEFPYPEVAKIKIKGSDLQTSKLAQDFWHHLQVQGHQGHPHFSLAGYKFEIPKKSLRFNHVLKWLTELGRVL